MNKTAHEWLAWVLLVGVGGHLWLNRRALSTYFKRPLGVALMSAGAVVLVVSSVVPEVKGDKVPVRQVLAALTTVPISTLAEVAGTKDAVLLAALSASHPSARADQSLTELAGGDADAGISLLARVYQAIPAN